MNDRTKTLKPYLDKVLNEGMSINSQAVEAGVDISILRRLVIKDPRYPAAVAAGKVVSRPRVGPNMLKGSDAVKAVVEGGLSFAEAANLHGLAETTVRGRVKKAYPEMFGRGGLNGLGVSEPPGVAYEVEEESVIGGGVAQPVDGQLPVISWETAKAWKPESGAIPREKIEGWMGAARPHSPHAYVLTIQDNGMTAQPGSPRSFQRGCKIFVDAGETDVKDGDYVVARVVASDSLVFRLYHSELGRRWLEPLNSMYEPIREPFIVVGKVFGKWEDL